MDNCHTVIDTPIGPLTLVAGPSGLREVRFPNGRPIGEADGPARPDHPVLAQAATELAEYFAGTRQDFDVPLDPQGSPFQLSAWRGLTTIPFAETVSYGEQARRLGQHGVLRTGRSIGLAERPTVREADLAQPIGPGDERQRTDRRVDHGVAVVHRLQPPWTGRDEWEPATDHRWWRP